MAYSGNYERLRGEQPNVRMELDTDDTVLINNIGFDQSVRARYFLSRMLESVAVNDGNIVFTFADGGTQSISLTEGEFV